MPTCMQHRRRSGASLLASAFGLNSGSHSGCESKPLARRQLARARRRIPRLERRHPIRPAVVLQPRPREASATWPRIDLATDRFERVDLDRAADCLKIVTHDPEQCNARAGATPPNDDVATRSVRTVVQLPSRTRRTGRRPGLPRREERLARHVHGCAPEPWIPSPRDERALEVGTQRLLILAAVARRIFDLRAQRGRRHADEHELHRRRWHVPSVRATRRNVLAVVARRVRRAVTRRALLADHAATFRTALHVLLMHVAIVAL